MKEIDKDFYCSAGFIVADKSDYCAIFGKILADRSVCSNCIAYHHKWPTPEQFEKEYEIPYPDDAAVYANRGCSQGKWLLMPYKEFKTLSYNFYWAVVCACTPWGKPLEDWRPD